MKIKLIDITGKRFGRLKVLNRAQDHTRPNGQKVVRWLCQCDCGNTTTVDSGEIRKGKVKSCGCLARELTSQREKEVNTYVFDGEATIGYTIYNEPFYIDSEDYDRIKEFYWRINDDGYVISNRAGLLHRYIVNCPNESVVDHIESDQKHDNRKKNLRICTQSDNLSRKSIMKNNTSGIIGVSWSNDKNKWLVRLNKNRKCVYLKYFDSKQDAIAARLKAELKYFGEFAPQKELFEQYNIK